MLGAGSAGFVWNPHTLLHGVIGAIEGPARDAAFGAITAIIEGPLLGTNFTASHISARISRESARTCGTSRQQSLANCVNRSAVEGRDRVGDVTLRPQRRRLGVGNHGVGQAFRI